MTNYSLEVNFSQIYIQLLTGTKKAGAHYPFILSLLASCHF